MPETAPPNTEAADPEVPAAAQQLQRTAETVSEHAYTLASSLTEWLETHEWITPALARWSANLILLAALGVLAWLLYLVVRPLLLRWIQRIAERSSHSWLKQLFGHGVFRWLTHVFPALLLYLASPGLFASAPALAGALTLLASLYILLAGFFVVDSLLNAGQAMLRDLPLARRMNLGTFVQVIKLLAALLVVIVAIAILLGRSPFVLLGGLGVFASVLMLVFKDVILGFVAGIQLASNRMLSLGDWLEMPDRGADGDVEEIGLTTVKVRNWDQTITTIPTYTLITESFKNWRGMSEGGGRRIKRALLIDTNTVRLCDEEMLARFREIEHIAAYLERKQLEIEEYNQKLGACCQRNRVNGRRLTNIGTFRAYVEAYLRNHPDINQHMILLVRQLEPVGEGLPIEVYCFSSNKNWVAYEGIQADIFDHLIAVAPEFDLRIYQRPSGVDIREGVAAARGIEGGNESGSEGGGAPPEP